MSKFTVWYMTPKHFPAGMCGAPPAPDLSTHRAVMTFNFPYTPGNDEAEIEPVLDKIYHDMQGENWSPRGEMRPLIEKLGLQHTSMSVGDVIEYHQGRGMYWVVATFGFTLLNRDNNWLRTRILFQDDVEQGDFVRAPDGLEGVITTCNKTDTSETYVVIGPEFAMREYNGKTAKPA